MSTNVGQLEKCLPGMYQVLGTIPTTTETGCGAMPCNPRTLEMETEYGKSKVILRYIVTLRPAYST